jgi:hypothetical protein
MWCLVLIALAQADAGVAVPDPVPDASLRAMTGNVVRLEVEGQPEVEGRLVGFEEHWVTVARSGNDEVVSVPREKVARLLAVEAPARERIVGVHFGMTVSLEVDAQWRLLYGFVNGNVLFPLTTVAGTDTWIALAGGAGITLPLARGSRWHADLFGLVAPLYLGGSYTYLGMGFGAGLRFDAHSGFSFGIKVPLIGYAARIGNSPYGYDSPFHAAYGFGYYYLSAVMGLPVLSVGYRF